MIVNWWSERCSSLFVGYDPKASSYMLRTITISYSLSAKPSHPSNLPDSAMPGDADRMMRALLAVAGGAPAQIAPLGVDVKVSTSKWY